MADAQKTHGDLTKNTRLLFSAFVGGPGENATVPRQESKVVRRRAFSMARQTSRATPENHRSIAKTNTAIDPTRPALGFRRAESHWRKAIGAKIFRLNLADGVGLIGWRLRLARPFDTVRSGLFDGYSMALGKCSLSYRNSWYAQGESNPCSRRERAVS